MKPLPAFSRSQLGVILVLAATLLGLYLWRAHWFFPPSPALPKIMHLAFVEVTGPVAHPGIYSFPQPPTLGEVWQRAGAPGEAPDKATKIASGTRVEVIPNGGYRLASMSAARLLSLGLPLELNRARAADLKLIRGIGPVLAKRIVDYRKDHGPFKKVEDLEKVAGLGPEKVAKIKASLVVGKTNGTAD